MDKKAITLINPSGVQKHLTNVEFFEMQIQFAKSKLAQRWSTEKNIALWIGKDQRLSVSAVNRFLVEMGYQIIDNIHDGKS